MPRERATALLVGAASAGDHGRGDPRRRGGRGRRRARGRHGRPGAGPGTNATDALDADLLQLGLAGEVDVVANSSVYGVHKPGREFFEQACAALDTPPARVLFVDDTDRFVQGARAAGLPAYRWTGPQDLPYLRAALAM